MSYDDEPIGLEKHYSFSCIEEEMINLWANSGVYLWKGGNDFIIDTPPPTISGDLHMGHIFSYCHTDFIARFQRMLGKDVFYPMGYDDNGLPTERLVEKLYALKAAKEDRTSFANLCEKVSDAYQLKFSQFFKRIGLSIDWNLSYHTMDERCRRISQASFVQLFQKGCIQRLMSPVMWDPVDCTALSQADIEEKEFNSTMNYIQFYCTTGEPLTIATTRPELLAGCVAILFNPEDDRYKWLNGKKAKLPLSTAEVPIIADSLVKIEKGSGLVMCCTFGDELDVLWCRHHSLSLKPVLDVYGKLRNLLQYQIDEDIADKLEGLKVDAARKQILEELGNRGLLLSETPITHKVKCAERSGSPIEILSKPQWFIKLIDIKQELLAQSLKCNWHPEWMKAKMISWIENLDWDWCISRQRYYGVPIPVWYSKRKGEEGRIILPTIDALPVNPKSGPPMGYTLEEVEPETDVMDTWATSALSPQINANYLCDDFTFKGERKHLFPAHLRPQSHEIIRTWAFYTISRAYMHSGKLPWDNIMISGWCLASDRAKMSKSKGNIVSPEHLLDTFGADAVRYWASTARLGADTVLSENSLKIGKRILNKLWNAAKFVAPFMLEYDQNCISAPLDLWILSVLEQKLLQIETNLHNFCYCEARELAEHFFWHYFCDNYLELVKFRTYNAEQDGHNSARHSLSLIMIVVLKIFAPFFPYITDKLYSQMQYPESIHAPGQWPKLLPVPSSACDLPGEQCFEILRMVREYKSSKNLSIKSTFDKLTVKINTQAIVKMSEDLRSACNVEVLHFEIADNSPLEVVFHAS